MAKAKVSSARLTSRHWILFATLAAVLAVTNLYATLLTGWATGGSIISVVISVLALRALGQSTSLAAINLGQTMASAGGAVGVGVAAYAAVRMADPSFEASAPMLIAAFLAMAILGTAIGAALRKNLVGYHFPSGTACAVIQKSVTGEVNASRRSLRLLSAAGVVAAIATVPTKIATTAHGGALLTKLSLGTIRGHAVGISLDPVLCGIGLVVGPRIAGGLLLGSAASAHLVPTFLERGGVEQAAHANWTLWIAIGVLTLPTFVGVFFARLFRQPAVLPPGFEPGLTSHPVHAGARRALIATAVLAAIATISITAIAYEIAIHWVVIATAVSGPLCLVNGRITADTDINPLLLVVLVVMTGFALVGGLSAVMLLGLGIIASTVVGLAVDTMQDYRTGYLLDQDPHRQTAYQLAGAVVGVLVAVPLLLILDATLGFGEGGGLPSPGAQIYTGIAGALAGGPGLSSGLTRVVVAVSAAASFVAFLSAWPPSKRYIPSLFGIGMGLLLPFEMSAAIFVGAAIRTIAEKASGDKTAGQRDVILVGSAIFAASALVTVLTLGLALALDSLGLAWFHFAA